MLISLISVLSVRAGGCLIWQGVSLELPQSLIGNNVT